MKINSLRFCLRTVFLTLLLFAPAAWAQSGCGLGMSWDETEVAGWQGRWTRAGATDEFDAVFTHPNGMKLGARLKMFLDRRNVIIVRWNQGTWGMCSYTGTFSADMMQVGGMYQCSDAAQNWTPYYAWSAKVNCNAAPVMHIDLNGRWQDQGGAIFEIRQSGASITWRATSPDGGASWTHSFSGIISGDSISGRFIDQPPGRNRSSGELTFRIVNGARLELTASSTPFGSTILTR